MNCIIGLAPQKAPFLRSYSRSATELLTTQEIHFRHRKFSVSFAYFVNSIEKSVAAVSHGDQSDAVEVNLQLVAVNCVVKARLDSWDKSDASTKSEVSTEHCNKAKVSVSIKSNI